jgi:hypothetical protein
MFEFWNSRTEGGNIVRRCPERIRNVSEATTPWTPNGILNEETFHVQLLPECSQAASRQGELGGSLIKLGNLGIDTCGRNFAPRGDPVDVVAGCNHGDRVQSQPCCQQVTNQRNLSDLIFLVVAIPVCEPMGPDQSRRLVMTQ